MGITKDQQNRTTGRFGGIRWDPPEGWRSRGYVSGRWEEGSNSSNDAKYSDYVPLLYGTAWVDTPVLNVVGDANYTAMEVLVSAGEIDSVLRVVVNDVLIQESGRGGDSVGGFWDLLSTGARDGRVNTGTLYDGAGDCYGSMAVLHVRVPRALAGSQSIPRVRVLARGAKIPVLDAGGSWVRQYSENPAWVLYDLLTWAGWSPDDLDRDSFQSAAEVCQTPIEFLAHDGAVRTHERFTTSLCLHHRRGAADLIRGIRIACRGLLLLNSDGKLRLAVKQTLADQQPTPMVGSNDVSVVSSMHADGTVGNGYAAYHFDDSNIILRSGRSTLAVRQSTSSDSPNQLQLTFQNREIGYDPDFISEADVEEIQRRGQTVARAAAIDGVTSTDHARRILGTLFAESYRGNPRGDTGGTWQFEWETSIRAAHLHVGDIVLLSSDRLGIARQPVRLTKIQPSQNFETVRLTGHWHEDLWYTDGFGQSGEPGYDAQRRRTQIRPPHGWQPYEAIVPEGDALWQPGSYTFAVDPKFEASSDRSTLVKLAVTGRAPVNTVATLVGPPRLPLQGLVEPGGGELSGGVTYWVQVCAKNVSGTTYFGLSAPSDWCRVDVPPGDGYSIRIPRIRWAKDTAGYVVFLGRDPNRLTFALEGEGTPAEIAVTGPSVADQWAAPDTQFSRLQLRAKRVLRAGVLTAEIVSCSALSITVDGARWEPNQWSGYDCSVIGKRSGRIPVANFRIAGNTQNILTLEPGTGDPVALGIEAGDLLVIRSRPAVVTPDSITDPGWDNSSSTEPAQQIVEQVQDSPLQLRVPGHGCATGDRVRIDGAPWISGAGRVFEVTVLGVDELRLEGATTSGVFESGATLSRLTGGLLPNELAGKLLRVIAGTGRGLVTRVASNSGTTIQVEAKFSPPLDQTSRYIIEEPVWSSNVTSSPIDNYSWLTKIEQEVEVDNVPGQIVLVQPVPQNAIGQESVDPLTPVREVYIYGDPGERGESGGGLVLSVAGTLAIGSDLAPPVTLPGRARVRKIRALLKQPAVGSDLILSLQVNGAWFATIPVAAGARSGETTSLTTDLLPEVPEGAVIRLDILQAGTVFPGADLTCTLFT